MYGSGKTLTSREEFYKHLFLTPNGNTLIGANVQSQYEQTIKRDIEGDLPMAFFKDWSSQKQWCNFINGHRLIYRPFDDPNKLRSYNLSMWIMVEASEVVVDSFTQLKTRLRSATAGIQKVDKDGPVFKTTKTGVQIPVMEADWRKGIIESNPDVGWIRDDVLSKSSDIYKHGDIKDVYANLTVEIDPKISTHITATSCNEFLPDDFWETNAKNKPKWWINRYLYGSFLYAEGLVYPSAMANVIPEFPVPKNWLRCVAFDYGLSDDAVFVFAAIDQDHGQVYIYKEVRTNNRSVKELAKLYHENVKDIPSGGFYCQPLIDPKSGPKRDYDKKSLSDHFLEYNIAFQPGQVSIDARVFRLNTYFESGRLKIMDCCTALIKEFKDYKFKTRALTDDGFTDKPVDRNNHGINPVEWIAMELPENPAHLTTGGRDGNGNRLTVQTEQIELENAYVHSIFSEPEQNDDDIIDYQF